MKKLLLVGLLCAMSSMAMAQSTVRYFGYYYDDANGSFQENYDHINLFNIQQMIIGAGDTADLDATTKYVLSQLAQAKARGVRATINAAPYVFHWTDSAGTWSAESNAAANWSAFVNQLVASGYIVPGRPDLSTVVAIYLIDEPDQNGFGDVDGAVNPTLADAVSVVRSNSSTNGIPLASILTTNFAGNFSHGMTLFDWVGFDWYGSTQSQWTSRYNQLKSMLSASQRTIIVPKAALGASVGSGSYDDPNFFKNIFNTDTKVVWFSPFAWFSNSSITGTRDIPALRSAYTQIGSGIRSTACSSSAAERGFCQGSARKVGTIAAVNMLLQ
jgi:hypothetical protein